MCSCFLSNDDNDFLMNKCVMKVCDDDHCWSEGDSMTSIRESSSRRTWKSVIRNERLWILKWHDVSYSSILGTQTCIEFVESDKEEPGVDRRDVCSRRRAAPEDDSDDLTLFKLLFEGREGSTEVPDLRLDFLLEEAEWVTFLEDVLDRNALVSLLLSRKFGQQGRWEEWHTSQNWAVNCSNDLDFMGDELSFEVVTWTVGWKETHLTAGGPEGSMVMTVSWVGYWCPLDPLLEIDASLRESISLSLPPISTWISTGVHVRSSMVFVLRREVVSG